MTRADLSKQPAHVAAMFDDVARHYDRTNLVLSGGMAALWRRETTRAVNPAPGERVLDVAAGTGTSSVALARTGSRVTAVDLSTGMLALGRLKHADDPFVDFVQGDATALPFDDDVFDAVTISFGLRNIARPADAIAEFFRVLRPAGRLVVCEFSTPTSAPLRRAYGAYLSRVMPSLVRVASSDPPAYAYLMESILDWPEQAVVAGWIKDAGFTRVQWKNLTGGVVALHRGVKPASGRPVGRPSAEPVVEPTDAGESGVERRDADPVAPREDAEEPAADRTSAEPPTSTSPLFAPQGRHVAPQDVAHDEAQTVGDDEARPRDDDEARTAGDEADGPHDADRSS